MTFLFWGFAAMFAVIAAYVWTLGVRQRKLAEDLEMFGDVLEGKRSE